MNITESNLYNYISSAAKLKFGTELSAKIIEFILPLIESNLKMEEELLRLKINDRHPTIIINEGELDNFIKSNINAEDIFA